jgi:hypothetical protein
MAEKPIDVTTVEVTRPGIAARVRLQNICEIETKPNGAKTIKYAFQSLAEWASQGLFGKFIAELSPEESAQISALSDPEVSDLGERVMVMCGNPTGD